MEHQEKTLPTAQLLEEYRALLDTVETLPLAITGSSMGPFLVPGRDSVLLEKPKRPLRCGDIVLYRRESGAYILHRVCRCCADGSYCMIGDAQRIVEPGIRPEQVLAVVRSARRKGRYQGPGRFWWEFFARVWIRVIPQRERLLGLYTELKAIGRIFS